MFPAWTDRMSILLMIIMTFVIRMLLLSSASILFSRTARKSNSLSAAFASGLVLFAAPLLIAYLAG